MIQTFIIQQKLPSLNEVTHANRSHWSVGAKAKKDIEAVIGWEIIRQRMKPVRTYPIQVDITFYETNNKRDVDNIMSSTKFIFDALKKRDIIVDDSPIYIPKPPTIRVVRDSRAVYSVAVGIIERDKKDGQK